MRTKFACLKIITLTLISLLMSSSAFAGINILFPTSNDVKAVSDIHVIAQSDTDEPVEIIVNGQSRMKSLICTDPEKKRATTSC